MGVMAFLFKKSVFFRGIASLLVCRCDMLSRRMTSAVVLLIGGCTQREEHGALSSVEEVSFQRTSGGVQLLSRIVGDLQEARRSPSVFVEKHGILVVGGKRWSMVMVLIRRST